MLKKLCLQHGLDDKEIKNGYYDIKELMEKIKNINDFWEFTENGIYLYTDKAYVSASKSMHATKLFGAVNGYLNPPKYGAESRP